MSVLQLQAALLTHGFDPGPLDGALGPRTRAAIRAFQTAAGLQPDGVAGPLTLGALGLATDEPLWLAEARRLEGLTERPGKSSNPAILDWAERLDLNYASDDVPWCGLFVGHCIAAALPDEPLPQGLLSARTWMKFGRVSEPGLGAVLVFWRGSRAGWRGHVGFCVGADVEAFHVLGGNQGDRVCVARLSKGRLLGARWPLSGGEPPSRAVAFTGLAGTPLSRNEA
ncbi:TIGR02594 family protein [Brevundimonas sp. 2R-24]|uniref:TIGR02594 family protein n=1 Tax=Peiella sedimenti TaxID=3061083 RepID=A0ABT8SMI3_9CAUL|nr:TIGR02594 family protein [Caulobacteraceae bacterium XZ-24]